MTESSASPTSSRATPRAALAALGVKLCDLDLFGPIRARVQVPQKTVLYTPIDKLYDCFIGILAGAKGIADINRVLRADPALQAAFGRDACAEQSTIQDTLDACTPTTVSQMGTAVEELFRRHSRAARHDFAQGALLLDVDLTGNPCGKKAACAMRGYFPGQKNRRGRQLGRVLATAYQEIVVDRLFPGNTSLLKALEPIVLAAEEALSLTEEQRTRTIVRLDAGGGSVDAVNWLLSRGYMVLCKDYSASRARNLSRSVTTWYPDPKEEGREVGWVEEATRAYVRPVRRLSVRHRKPNGQFGVEVLITTAPMAELFRWTRMPATQIGEAQAELLAIAHSYDQRGGGCETSFQGDKQGLGMGKRNKKRFEAQQMVVALGALAHNVLIWAKEWLLPKVPRLEKYGIKRLVRDVMEILGRVEWEEQQRVRRILLTETNPLSRQVQPGLQQMIAKTGVVVVLGPP